ncbi:peptidase U62 modulator of DNA gyrase [Alicycliphilus sp. B1]|nr:peptidase U62 modulator of DNA gyrase [Alicycliphilus sp. B1]
MGVRAVSGEKTAFAYSDDISEASLLDAARTVRSISATAQSGRARVASKKIAKSRSLYPHIDPIASMDSTAKVQLLERAEQRARAKIHAWRRSWRALPASTTWSSWRAPTARSRPTCARWCACRSP